MKIAIFGGTGFIGSAWIDHALQQGHRIILFSRQPEQVKIKRHRFLSVLSWPVDDVLQVDAVINLAGETINQRWSTAAKERILQSRLAMSQAIVQAIQTNRLQTKTIIQASAVGFYGDSLNHAYTEANCPQRDVDDFLGKVTDAWEAEIEKVEKLGVRLINARFGIALGQGGGALSRMVLPYQLFVGGQIGTGQQWVSWIHLNDLVRLLNFCLTNKQIKGAVNFTSPHPCTMNTLGKEIAAATQRPHWLPLPDFLLKGILGDMSALILKGQQVLPSKVLEQGFTFQFPTIQSALEDILKKEHG